MREVNLREKEKSKIACASRHFASLSSSTVKYDAVTSYDDLYNIVKMIRVYNRKNETCNFQKRNEQIFSFFASFFLLLFRPLKHQLKADFKPLKQA